MMYRIAIFILTIIISLGTTSANGQSFGIGIVRDASDVELRYLSSQIKSEIESLTKRDAKLVFYEKEGGWQKEKTREYLLDFMNNPGIDIVVTVGLLSSDVASQLSDFSKPLIAATILDEELQDLSVIGGQTSGVHNFSYIKSPVQIKKDLRAFSELFNASHVTVVFPENIYEQLNNTGTWLNGVDDSTQLSFLSLSPGSALSPALPSNTEAVVVLPMTGRSTDEISELFSHFNKLGIPSLAIKGTDYLELGATVTFTPRFSILQMARATATRVVKVIEGYELSDIPVIVGEENRRLVVNMESVRQINRFPVWSHLQDAVLMNVEKVSGEELGLHEAISLALENNLEGRITDRELLMAGQDVKIARSNVLPAVDVSASGVQLSENLVESSMGQKGEFTITGSVSLRQVIYSEEAFANVAIQKLLAENEKHNNRATTLDIVKNVVEAYVNLLYAKNNYKIRNENVNANLQNLEIAKSKEKAGASSVSDVNRWESEVNLSRMELNEAEAAYKSAMYRLNRLLNRKVDQPVSIPDSFDILGQVIKHRELLAQCFNDPLLTEYYADFIIEQMRLNSPELKKIATAGDIAGRKRKLYSRKSYLPEVAIVGGADQAFVREGIIRNPQLPVPEPPDDITWNVGLNMRFSLFEGAKRKNELKRTVLEQEKIEWQKQALTNEMQTGIRAGVQQLQASFKDMALAENAAAAADENFRIIQDAYNEGVVGVIELIDAQNMMIRTKLLSVNARYSYVLNYANTERLQGEYSFLKSDEDHQQYAENLANYLSLEKI